MLIQPPLSPTVPRPPPESDSDESRDSSLGLHISLTLECGDPTLNQQSEHADSSKTNHSSGSGSRPVQSPNVTRRLLRDDANKVAVMLRPLQSPVAPAPPPESDTDDSRGSIPDYPSVSDIENAAFDHTHDTANSDMMEHPSGIRETVGAAPLSSNSIGDRGSFPQTSARMKMSCYRRPAPISIQPPLATGALLLRAPPAPELHVDMQDYDCSHVGLLGHCSDISSGLPTRPHASADSTRHVHFSPVASSHWSFDREDYFEPTTEYIFGFVPATALADCMQIINDVLQSLPKPVCCASMATRKPDQVMPFNSVDPAPIDSLSDGARVPIGTRLPIKRHLDQEDVRTELGIASDRLLNQDNEQATIGSANEPLADQDDEPLQSQLSELVFQHLESSQRERVNGSARLSSLSSSVWGVSANQVCAETGKLCCNGFAACVEDPCCVCETIVRRPPYTLQRCDLRYPCTQGAELTACIPASERCQDVGRAASERCQEVVRVVSERHQEIGRAVLAHLALDHSKISGNVGQRSTDVNVKSRCWHDLPDDGSNKDGRIWKHSWSTPCLGTQAAHTPAEVGTEPSSDDQGEKMHIGRHQPNRAVDVREESESESMQLHHPLASKELLPIRKGMGNSTAVGAQINDGTAQPRCTEARDWPSEQREKEEEAEELGRDTTAEDSNAELVLLPEKSCRVARFDDTERHDNRGLQGSHVVDVLEDPTSMRSLKPQNDEVVVSTKSRQARKGLKTNVTVSSHTGSAASALLAPMIQQSRGRREPSPPEPRGRRGP